MVCHTGQSGDRKGNPYKSLYGKGPPESRPFFRRQVYERVGKFVFFGLSNYLKGLQEDFMAAKKLRKFPSFMIY